MKHGPHYYVVVYDAKVKHVTKVLNILRKYLHWVQNSVFEGTLTVSQFLRLQQELRRVIDPNHDSVIFYRFPQQYLSRHILGREKGSTEMIL